MLILLKLLRNKVASFFILPTRMLHVTREMLCLEVLLRRTRLEYFFY
jgi:hypothetical protein